MCSSVNQGCAFSISLHIATFLTMCGAELTLICHILAKYKEINTTFYYKNVSGIYN